MVIEVLDAEGKKAPKKHSTLFELLRAKQCSVRLHNVIHHNWEALGITKHLGAESQVKVGDLEGVSTLKFLSCLNVGATTVKEFKELCAICGVRWVP